MAKTPETVIGRYINPLGLNLVEITEPGNPLVWRLSQNSPAWFSGTVNPSTTIGFLIGDLYLNTATGTTWQLQANGWVEIASGGGGGGGGGNLVYVSAQSGSDAGQKIAAAFLAVNPGGTIIVDLLGAQVINSDVFTSVTIPVQMIWTSGQYTFNVVNLGSPSYIAVTMPENISHSIQQGVLWKTIVGGHINVCGSFDAGNYQVFQLSGSNLYCNNTMSAIINTAAQSGNNTTFTATPDSNFGYVTPLGLFTLTGMSNSGNNGTFSIASIQQNKAVIQILSASQSGSTTTYGFKGTAMELGGLQVGYSIIITGCTSSGNNGTFTITGITPDSGSIPNIFAGVATSGTFTVTNPSGVTEFENGQGNVPAIFTVVNPSGVSATGQSGVMSNSGFPFVNLPTADGGIYIFSLKESAYNLMWWGAVGDFNTSTLSGTDNAPFFKQAVLTASYSPRAAILVPSQLKPFGILTNLDLAFPSNQYGFTGFIKIFLGNSIHLKNCVLNLPSGIVIEGLTGNIFNDPYVNFFPFNQVEQAANIAGNGACRIDWIVKAGMTFKNLNVTPPVNIGGWSGAGSTEFKSYESFYTGSVTIDGGFNWFFKGGCAFNGIYFQGAYTGQMPYLMQFQDINFQNLGIVVNFTGAFSNHIFYNLHLQDILFESLGTNPNVLNITAAAQSGSNTTYTFTYAGAPVNIPSAPPNHLTITGMAHSGNNGTFNITAVTGNANGGTFTVVNPSGATATETGTAIAPAGNPALGFVGNLGGVTNVLMENITVADSSFQAGGPNGTGASYGLIGINTNTTVPIDTTSNILVNSVVLTNIDLPACYFFQGGTANTFVLGVVIEGNGNAYGVYTGDPIGQNTPSSVGGPASVNYTYRNSGTVQDTANLNLTNYVSVTQTTDNLQLLNPSTAIVYPMPGVQTLNGTFQSGTNDGGIMPDTTHGGSTGNWIYYATVQDDQGQQSTSASVTVNQTAGNNGEVSLTWTPVAHASGYQIGRQYPSGHRQIKEAGQNPSNVFAPLIFTQDTYSITAASQSGSYTTYTYTTTAPFFPTLGRVVTITGMGHSGNNGTFTVANAGTLNTTQFTVYNPGGVTATETGTAVASATAYVDLEIGTFADGGIPATQNFANLMRIAGGQPSRVFEPWLFDTILRKSSRPPAQSNMGGLLGQYEWDTGFIYVCTASALKVTLTVTQVVASSGALTVSATNTLLGNGTEAVVMEGFSGGLSFLNGRLYQITAATTSTFTITENAVPNGTYTGLSLPENVYTGTWERAAIATWTAGGGLNFQTFFGNTSGSFTIGAANTAGTPNRMNFPTSTGTAGQVLTTDGGNPQQLSWSSVSGTGTVTSVGMVGDGVIFNSAVTNSPVTSSGNLTPVLLTQTANTVLAGPNTGSAAAPTFRALVAADIPSIPASQLSNGTTGTGAVVLAGSPALTGNPTATTQVSSDNSTKLATTAFVQSVALGAGAVTSVFGRAGVVVANTGDYSFSQISGTVAAAQLPTPTNSTLGGVESNTPVSHQWINAFNTSGVPQLSQPAFTDISGTIAIGQTVLTTLGDLLYVNSSPALARLAGNTTTTRQFLAQTGTGSVSAAPAWASPSASDLSNGVTGTGAVVLAGSPTLTGTPLSTTPSTSDSSTKIATTAYVQAQKYAATFGSTTSLSITGATHGLGTADLQFTIYDSATGTRNVIQPGSISVDSTTFNVTVTFAVNQAGRIVISGV